MGLKNMVSFGINGIAFLWVHVFSDIKIKQIILFLPTLFKCRYAKHQDVTNIDHAYSQKKIS